MSNAFLQVSTSVDETQVIFTIVVDGVPLAWIGLKKDGVDQHLRTVKRYRAHIASQEPPLWLRVWNRMTLVT